MTQLVIFTAPKPFKNPHISTIQTNAIRSWTEMGREVEIVLLGKDEGIGEAAKKLDVNHIPDIEVNAQGTPLISSMVALTRQHFPAPLYMIINTDILLFPEILASIQKTREQADQFLMVGQRWDLPITELLNFSAGWEDQLKNRVITNGSLHPRGGSDYFIFPDYCYQSVPDFAIGRAGWDNWMIYEGRHQGWRVIDATRDVMAVHQNHDYSHLPDGKPHYKLPETFENIRLAGGERTIFTLMDTDAVLVDGKVKKAGLNWTKFWREVEVFPLIRLKSYTLAQLFYAAFHPVKAYREFRAWKRNKDRE